MNDENRVYERVMADLAPVSGREVRNPLLVLGFSHHVLGWGFSADELYEICRELARRIAGRAHPDDEIGRGISPDDSRRIIAAAAALRDRVVFDRALKELKDGRADWNEQASELRREVNVLTKSLKLSRQERKEEKDKRLAAEAEGQALTHRLEDVNSLRSLSACLVSRRGGRVYAATPWGVARFLALRIWGYEHTAAPGRELTDRLTRLARGGDFEEIRRVLRRGAAWPTEIDNFLKAAISQTGVRPVLWGLKEAVRSFGFKPKTPDPEPDLALIAERTAAFEASYALAPGELEKLYKDGLRAIAAVFAARRVPYVTHFRADIEDFAVERGAFIMSERDVRHYPYGIIGSMLPEETAACRSLHLHERFFVNDRREGFAARPLLAPGRFLFSNPLGESGPGERCILLRADERPPDDLATPFLARARRESINASLFILALR